MLMVTMSNIGLLVSRSEKFTLPHDGPKGRTFLHEEHLAGRNGRRLVHPDELHSYICRGIQW